jgi:hypothetical protein
MAEILPAEGRDQMLSQSSKCRQNQPRTRFWAAATLRRLIDQPRQVVAVAGNKPTKVTRRTVAIRFIKDDQKKFGILDDALLRILGSRKAKAIFTAELAEAKLIPNGHGHAGTIQDRIPIKRNGRIIARPRLWVIDAARLSRFLTNNSAAPIRS